MTTYYTKFSTEQFFENENYNGYLNQIFTFLINILGDDYVSQNLVLDNAIAESKQSEDVVPMSTIDLFTNKRDIFLNFKLGIKLLSFEDYEINGETITITTLSTKINFRFEAVEIETQNTNGIYYKDINNIKKWR